uniref:Putative LOV domain-containing protein n=1 Tax=Volvox aureus TaxID=47287 RepID=A0A126X3E1_VOLAU|nr:putative LOV domain-containing protein [Volvox aureus]
MSQKPRQITKAKKFEKKNEARDSPLEELVNEDAQPWKNTFRLPCALPPKDNSFTLEDEILSASMETALSSFTVSDPNDGGNTLCYVSPGFLSMTGYSEDECLGKNCRFLQAGKVDPDIHQSLHAAIAERRFATVEVTNYRKDGRPFQNLLSLAPVFSADNASLLHFVGVQCDLDERRRRSEPVDDIFVSKWEEQLKSCLSAFAVVDVSSVNFSSSISSSGQLLLPQQVQKSTGGADANGGQAVTGPAAGATASNGSPQLPAAICTVSPGFTALTGYSQSDVVGWNMLCLCGPDSPEKDMRKLITSQWGHTPTAVKMLCYKRDGTPFWALVLSCPLSCNPYATAAPGGTGTAGGLGAAGPAGQVPAGSLASARASAGKPSSGRVNPTPGVRQGGLGLGLFGGMAPGGGQVGGLLSALATGSPHGVGVAAAAANGSGSPGQLMVKYCLCCVVDITSVRLKKLAGGKYVLGKVIGAGAFGLVRIGKNTTTDELVAVKGVDATRFRNITEIDQIQEEMSVLSSLKHPNIIRLFDVHFQSNTFFLVMEFAGNGSLVQFMRTHGDPVKHSLEETTAARVFVQMVSALEYCHRRRVIHRDLKPENILMDEHNNVKIADFGLAAVAAPFSGGLTLQCGTPEFTAPEITVGREYDGASVDIWSMGVMLYEALCGALPFKGSSHTALFKAIQRGSFDPLPSHISSECKDLVRRMLVVDPQTRITMDEIMRHPWVTKSIAKHGADGRQGGTAQGGSPNRTGSSSTGMYGDSSDPLVRLQVSNDSGLLSLDNGHAAAGATSYGMVASGSTADDIRVGSVTRLDASVAGGGELRGGLGGARVSDGSGHQRALTTGSRVSPPRGALMGSGPTSPSLGGTPLDLPDPGSPVSLSGLQRSSADGLHDSVKLVLPLQVNRDDPILAALLRHGHVGGDINTTSTSPNRPDDGDDCDLPLQRSAHSYSINTHTGASSAGGAPATARREGVASSRGCVSRSIGGAPSMGGGGMHGQRDQANGNGKLRSGALLPTLSSAATTGGSAPGNSLLDRRMQDSTRFRSPARTGQAAGRGTGAMVVGIGGRTQQAGLQQPASPASPLPSPHTGAVSDGNGRQLPPIQAIRAPGKKSSWLSS